MIRRSAGQAASSGVNEVPLQPLPHSSEIARSLPDQALPPSSQPLSLSTEVALPSYTQPE